MKLTNFIGNEKVIDRLSKLMESGRFPHALIIEGEEGIGKKTLAKDIACALVCRGNDKPCGECSQCKKAIGAIHPDISEYIPAGTANSFHVDTVRNIINDAYVQPNEADYKIYMANAHCMNQNAQNALLKILEEPPKYVVFILTTNSKSALLSTVLSRSVCVSLEGVDIERAANYITSHCENVDYNTAKKTVETFNGNIGKAIDSLQDSKTSELVDVCNKICKALTTSNEYEMMTLCSVFQKDRQGVVFACDLLKSIFRDALFAGESSEHISGQEESAALLKSSLSRQSLIKLINTCDELKSTALSNANNALLITKFCYSLNRAIGR